MLRRFLRYVTLSNDDGRRCEARKKMTCFVIAMVLFVLLGVICGASCSFVLCLLAWVIMVIYGLKNIQERTALLVFLATFFLFLLGGEATAQFLNYDLELSFTKEIDQHAHIAILVSLIGVAVGFILMDRHVKKKECPVLVTEEEENKNTIIRNIGFVGFLCTIIPAYAQAIDAGIFVVHNGYLKYYTEYSCRLPVIVESLGELYTLFLFMYLASFPAKKKCVVPLCSYLLYGALWLISGRRLYVGISLLVVAFYVLICHFRFPKEKWITKKLLIACLCAMPLLVLGLYSYKYIRYGMAVDSINIFKVFTDFINQQGVSINAIKLSKELEGDSLGCTSLYYTLKYWRSSVLTRHIANFPYELYSIRSIETALNTNCLADYIIYAKSPTSYLSGYGYGTSYIAELYHDGGYLLVMAGSALYGVLLKWLYDLSPISPWKSVAALLVLEQFVVLPRYGADVIVSPFYNLTRFMTFVGCILLVELYSKFIKRKRFKNNEHQKRSY